MVLGRIKGRTVKEVRGSGSKERSGSKGWVAHMEVLTVLWSKGHGVLHE